MSREPDPPRVRLVAATVHGRYLACPPRAGAPRGWLVGFHGYGQSADDLLEPLRATPGADAWLVVAVQALHPFYDRANRVIANWMTRQDREHAIADNIAYVDAVLADLAGAFGAPRALVLAGFSQGVAMTYRAAVLGSGRPRTIVVAGGDLPPDTAIRAAREWPRVVLATGTRDTYYSPERLAADVQFLRTRGAATRQVVFEGGHEWSPEITQALGEELDAAGA